MYYLIELIAEVERAIPQRGVKNIWLQGEQFFVHQERPEEGMVVLFHPSAGAGIPPDCAMVLEEFDTHLEAYRAYEDRRLEE